MRIFSSALIIASLLTGSAWAQSYPTIVGEWYGAGYGQEDCGTPWSLTIEAMGMHGGEMACTFETVQRDQWMVTWTGECGNIDYDATRVVAVENELAEELHLSFSHSGYTEVLKRCPAP